MSGDYSPADFASSLRRIEESRFDYFLEGGQAVNIWAEVYSVAAPSVAELAPFTSKDCDLWVGLELFRHIEGILPGGTLTKASDPSQGQLGIFTTDDNPPRVIDLFDGVFGLNREELNRARERSFTVDGVRLIDPVFLFKAKCHNLTKLPNQRARNDERHLKILLKILPAHFDALLTEALRHEPKASDRKLLSEIKLLRSFEGDKWVRRAVDQLAVSLDSLIPVERLRECGLPKTQAFVESEWPST